ncbi:MAG: NAD(P)-binding protein [Bacteroides stercoris]
MDVIIGAGVSGIAYAGFSENKCLLLEKDAEIGGYCKTIKQGNFVGLFWAFFSFQKYFFGRLCLPEYGTGRYITL